MYAAASWTTLCLSWIFQEELAAKVAEQQAAVIAAGLLDKKESEDSNSIIGPSMLEPEPSHTEVRATVAFPGTLPLMDGLKIGP